MARTYVQLSLTERIEIYRLWKGGHSLRAIAREVSRDVGTISRELKRNRTYYTKEYKPITAHTLCEERQRDQRTHAPLKNHLVFLYVREKIREEGMSPEAIAGRLALENPGESITPETIYRYIYGKGKKYKLWEHLPRKQKKRRKKTGRDVHGEKKQSRIPGAVSIEERSRKANSRTQAGHWETDLMEGRRGNSGALSVTVERKTRYTILAPLANKKAETLQKALQNRLQTVQSLQTTRKPIIRSITSDNGSENVRHREIAGCLNAKWYFCHPYHSWEKGTVENTIGRIRRYIPKGTPLHQYTPEQIQWLENKLNNTPRKCLGWKTPNEAMADVLNSYKWNTHQHLK